MKRDAVVRLYDDDYARSYEQKFLLSPATRLHSDFELDLIRGFLSPATPWLDVACGTGYFLSHFPQVERAGLDLSPAMLRLARQANPGVPLHQHDFRAPVPEWEDRWGLVSCMWYAYSLVDTVDELLQVIHNLAAWTSPAGTCFVPLTDPSLLCGVNVPYHAATPWDGKVVVTGILWSYVEDDGRKVHAHLVAPAVEFMAEQFARYFNDVEVLRYPPDFPGWQGRPALVARNKRAARGTEAGR
jgi:SAM-dependent methyltransferase